MGARELLKEIKDALTWPANVGPNFVTIAQEDGRFRIDVCGIWLEGSWWRTNSITAWNAFGLSSLSTNTQCWAL